MGFTLSHNQFLGNKVIFLRFLLKRAAHTEIQCGCLIPCELSATLECKFQDQEQEVGPGYIS